MYWYVYVSAKKIGFESFDRTEKPELAAIVGPDCGGNLGWINLARPWGAGRVKARWWSVVPMHRMARPTRITMCVLSLAACVPGLAATFFFASCYADYPSD